MGSEEFIKKAKKIHVDKYDYSKVEYVNNHTKVCIICPEHGEFWQTPKNHLKGCGCSKCSGAYKMSTEEWISVAKDIHDNKYDYSKAIYVNNKTKICIICPEHGEFWQIAGNHLKGEGCIHCRNEKFAKERSLNKECFIERIKKIHSDKYDYSKVEYVNNHTKVCIICPEHGEFWQTPANHLNGEGCPKCAANEKKIKEKKIDKKFSFIEKCRKKYGDKYDYSKVEYINNHTKVRITCPEHGDFLKTPNKFLNGQECIECKKEKTHENIKNKVGDFIKKANIIHNNKYDYSEINYVDTQHIIDIICPIHGKFRQKAASHLRGCGCPKCAKENRKIKQTKTTEKFIEEAKIKYPEFDYSEVDYRGRISPIKIICHKKFKNGKEHGPFFVLPSKFLGRGTNCPSCSKGVSYPEKEIYNYIKKLIGEENIKLHDRTILKNGHELDIYIPHLKIGFEFNGIYWHSDFIEHINKKTHLMKTEKCEEEGIHLIQIFSDEYFEHKEIVLEKIRYILGKCEKLPKIMARKCVIREIDWNECKNFLENYHIQGTSVSTIYLGAYYNNDLVGVMTFRREKEGSLNWELNRFASNYNYICNGLGGKLFKYFITHYEYNEIKSFADRRWSYRKKNIYLTLGFKEEKIIPPDYKYVNKNKPSLGRIHKFNFRKQILHKKYDLPLTMTELEMTKQLGFYRIYDCGLIKYVWKKEN